MKLLIADRAGDYSAPAAFGRLCVETLDGISGSIRRNPAAFGRLCVETATTINRALEYMASRLRAAVC